MFNFSPKSYFNYYTYLNNNCNIYLLSSLPVLTHHQCGISSTFSNGCSDTPVILKKWQSNKTLSNISLKHYKIAYHRQIQLKLFSLTFKLNANFFYFNLSIFNKSLITDNLNFYHQLLNSLLIFFYFYLSIFNKSQLVTMLILNLVRIHHFKLCRTGQIIHNSGNQNTEAKVSFMTVANKCLSFHLIWKSHFAN